MNRFLNQRGITLIALIVTIMVLLILVGISFSIAVDDNGIITKAQNASEVSNQAQIQEDIQTAYTVAIAKVDDLSNSEEIIAKMKTELEDRYGLVSVVSQDNGYLVTVDGENYFVGNTNSTSNNSNAGTTTTPSEDVQYTVQFCNYDGIALWSTTVKQGSSVTYDGTTPTRASDGTYSYTFNTWVTSKNGTTLADLSSIQSDKTVYASYVSQRICFVAGTKVLTENGLVNIEDIKVGMKVYSKNLEIGKIELKEVVQTFENYVDKDMVKVYTENGVIESTSNHPYYEKTKGWVSAKSLQVGDILINSNNEEVKVKAVENIGFAGNELNVVYNIEVEDNHNYFVGTDLVLVHNAGSTIADPIDKSSSSNSSDDESSSSTAGDEDPSGC